MRNVCKIPNCGRLCGGQGYCPMHYQRLRATGDPLGLKKGSPGSGTTHRGYRIFTVDGRRVREHVAIAEKALGRPLPAGAIVHHVDEDRSNNRNNNLVICQDSSYHHHLHQNLIALRGCGHADWRKCVYCHRYDDPQNLLKEGIKSPRHVHRECRNTTRRGYIQRAKQRNEVQL